MMVLPNKYSHFYLPVRSFLASERAYRDGNRAVDLLRRELESESLFLSDWRVHWVAATTLLRAAIDLFQIDQKMCHPQLALGVRKEWQDISDRRVEHAIFWEFLRKERNNIVHEYKWSAYERFLDRAGDVVLNPSILTLGIGDYDRELLIHEGKYTGANAFSVLESCRDWVDARLNSAIERAGLDPEEKRNVVSFLPRPPSAPSLMGTLLDQK
jgi:hypothetical protein